MKHRILILLVAISLILSGCLYPTKTQTPSPSTPLPAEANEPTPNDIEEPAPTETEELVQTETVQALPVVIVPSPLYKTSIFEDGRGWATTFDQSSIYSTDDYGTNWTEVTPSGLQSINGIGPVYVYFLDSTSGWLCQTTAETTSTLFSTIDKGSTWSQSNINFACGQLSFANQSDGSILSDLGVGAGSHYVAVYDTEDSGQTWSQTFTHEPASLDDHGLPSSGIKSHFTVLDNNIILVGGSAPFPGSLYLYRSDDDGASWSQVSCEGIPGAEESELSIADIVHIDSTGLVIAVRSYPYGGGAIATNYCSSTDSGLTWNYLSTLSDIEFSDFGNLSTGLAYGNGKFYLTQDGTASWQVIDPGLDSTETPVSLNVVNDDLFYLTTTLDPITLEKNLLYKSENAGHDWEVVPVSVHE